jgi:NitT/TauT family transport system permease protein
MRHAEVLKGGLWHERALSWRDFAAMVLVVAVMLMLGAGARQMVAPFLVAHQPVISLAPTALPLYTLRTVTRMLAALLASLLFTFTYATLAAKSRRAELLLIPLLDVLQSVPVLGYLSFTVVFFVSFVSRQRPGPGIGGDFRDLHRPGLEHGVQLLSGAAHHSN